MLNFENNKNLYKLNDNTLIYKYHPFLSSHDFRMKMTFTKEVNSTVTDFVLDNNGYSYGSFSDNFFIVSNVENEIYYEELRESDIRLSDKNIIEYGKVKPLISDKYIIQCLRIIENEEFNVSGNIFNVVDGPSYGNNIDFSDTSEKYYGVMNLVTDNGYVSYGDIKEEVPVSVDSNGNVTYNYVTTQRYKGINVSNGHIEMGLLKYIMYQFLVGVLEISDSGYIRLYDKICCWVDLTNNVFTIPYDNLNNYKTVYYPIEELIIYFASMAAIYREMPFYEPYRMKKRFK